MEKAQPKLMNRWLVVIGAILIQLCAGASYAWSVYTTGLKKAVGEGGYGMTDDQTQLPFAIALATFGIMMVFAGNWQKKVGPQKVALSGGILLGMGYILAGLFGSSLLTQVIFIGLLAGAGIGLAYVCPIATGVKWFPDKKGLISGLAVAGFGFGALIWMKMAGGFFGWNGLLGTLKFTFCNNSGIQSTWFIYGICYLLLILIGSIWMVNPPDDYKPAGWTPPAPSDKVTTGAVEFDQWAMLKSPQFYMLWFCFIAGAMAGLMVIGVIKLFGTAALMQNMGFSEEIAKRTADTAGGVFLAIMNGIGRIFWGSVSDKIGRKTAIFIMCMIQGIAMLMLFHVGGMNTITLYIWAAIVGFNFGGNFALYPAATADYFGNKNVGVNYGWMFTAYAVGGLVGPYVLIRSFKKMAETVGFQTWMYPFMIAGALCLIAAVVILLVQKPKPASRVT